jgi:hydrogenase/urease accessory protein HupE
VSRIKFRKLPFFLIVLFLFQTVPVSAHNMTIGASRWCFGKNYLVANIDLNATLFTDIKGIKEGHYDLGSNTDKDLQKINAEVVQPYIDTRLSITVNDKAYPVNVRKIVHNENGLYTLWLTVDNIAFTHAANRVMIDYRMLFEETGNSHVNVAYLYLSDGAPDTVQKIFDFSQPASQTTFDNKNAVWELAVKGVANAPAETPKAELPVVVSSPDGMRSAVQKKAAAAPPIVEKANESKGRTQRPSDPGPGNQAGQAAEKNNAIAPSPMSQPAPVAPAGKSIWANIGEFILLGIEHILTGYDHIAFLLALIVIGLSIKEVLKIITAFTVAHSITLLLAALQILKLNSRLVESVIAFSICYVALENLLKKKVKYRWLVTFAFGLIHGFGFASALQELIVGKSNLILSVLSFNLGVETGQLMIFFVLLPVLHLLKKKMEFRIITVGASAAVFMVGFAWLLERVFDLKLLPI